MRVVYTEISLPEVEEKMPPRTIALFILVFCVANPAAIFGPCQF